MAFGAQFLNSSGGVVFDSSFPALGVVKKVTYTAMNQNYGSMYLYKYPGGASVGGGINGSVGLYNRWFWIPTTIVGYPVALPFIRLPNIGDWIGPDSRYYSNDHDVQYRTNMSTIEVIYCVPMDQHPASTSSHGVECYDANGNVTYSSDTTLFYIKGSLASDNPSVTTMREVTVGSSQWFCMSQAHQPYDYGGGLRRYATTVLRRQSSTKLEKRYTNIPSNAGAVYTVPNSQYRDNWGLYGDASAV
jgi:hypothetical protein